MARTTIGKNHIVLKRGSYYFRKRVPSDLIETLGRGEITKPLGTKVRRVADRLARAYGSRLDVGFDMVRDGACDEVDDQRLWVRAFADVALERLQADVDEALADALGTDRVDEVAEAYDDQYAALVEGVDTNEDWACRAALELGHVDPDTLPREFWRQIAASNLKASRNLRISETLPAIPASVQPVAAIAATPLPSDSNGGSAVLDALAKLEQKFDDQSRARNPQTIGDAVELYAKFKATKREEAIEDTRRHDLFLIPQRFAKFAGPDTILDDVSVEQVEDWLAEQVDSRAKKLKPISANTRSKFAGFLSTFFATCIDRHYALENPAKGLRVVRKTKSYDQRQAFDTRELRRLFNPSLREEVANGYPERFYVPALHLLQGARTNECCQLKLGDLFDVDGIPCMRIAASSEDQSTKTASSARVIPLHPTLARLGFGEYVAQRRAETGDDEDAQLFGNLTYIRGHGYQTKVVNYFRGERGYLNSIGIWQREKKVLYSLRHTAITRMERSGMEPLARTQIVGHARKGGQSEKVYISDRGARELLVELKKVDWADALTSVLG